MSAAAVAPAKRRYDRSIVEGPLNSAVWKIAWPSMLTNVIGGLQGMVDHALVGHLVYPTIVRLLPDGFRAGGLRRDRATTEAPSVLRETRAPGDATGA